MSRYSSSGSAGSTGLGILGVLEVIFVVLKLLKLIDWSWWLVLIPLWIDQIKAGNPITVTEPNMTRFIMSLN